MDNWNWILLVGGIAIGAVVVYIFLNPAQATTTNPQSIYTYETKKATPILTNSEVLEWKDWKGRDRKLTIHRKVKRNV